MATYDVSGKYAVITGGGSGLCLELVKLLLAKGCSVLIGDLALTAKAEELAKAYPHPPAEGNGNGNASLVFHKIDVTSWAQLSALWSRALSLFPRVDIVVPGAGIYDPPMSSFWYPPGVDGGPSRDAADAEIGTYATFSINLIHPIRLAQLAVGYWTTNKLTGNLLFVGSIAGNIAAIGTPFYYSSKAGLHNFVRSMNGLRQKLGIRVICIAPGIARTPLWEMEHTKPQLSESDHVLTAQCVAEAMLELCEDEKYGDGEIFEILEVGTADEPRQATRVVPNDLLSPQVPIAGLAGLQEQQEKIWKKLETEGLRV
ncbi:NAD(P)-binding protein [Xylariaceae sp. AK1471]|nr:NAD(P)-binding protein [Xylariaceae sp. AK1471]